MWNYCAATALNRNKFPTSGQAADAHGWVNCTVFLLNTVTSCSKKATRFFEPLQTHASFLNGLACYASAGVIWMQYVSICGVSLSSYVARWSASKEEWAWRLWNKTSNRSVQPVGKLSKDQEIARYTFKSGFWTLLMESAKRRVKFAKKWPSLDVYVGVICSTPVWEN